MKESEEDVIRTLIDKIDQQQKGGGTDRKFGLCSRCQWFGYQETSLGTTYGRCTYGEGIKNPNRKTLRPSNIDPIVKCSNYHPIGGLTTWQMKSMAWLIDVRKKRRTGIIGDLDEEVEVKITPPEED